MGSARRTVGHVKRLIGWALIAVALGLLYLALVTFRGNSGSLLGMALLVAFTGVGLAGISLALPDRRSTETDSDRDE